MEELRAELTRAVVAGVSSEESTTDARYQLDKAVQQAKKPEPDKKSVLDHLNEAKALIEGVAAAGGLVTALTQAAEAVWNFL